MSGEPKEIFKKISSPEERERVATDLIRLQGELLCKAKASDEVFHLMALRSAGPLSISCAHRSGEAPPFPVPAEIIVSFSIQTQKYFLTTKLKDLGGNYFEINFTENLFQLQRRQNYRVFIPDNYRTEVSITVAGKKISGSVLDLSSGGLRARILVKRSDCNFSINHLLQGKFKIGDRPAIPFKGQLRHMKDDTTKEGFVMLGIEFLDLSKPIQAQLFSMTMELHREMFSKW